jgi:hypothetical protein
VIVVGTPEVVSVYEVAFRPAEYPAEALPPRVTSTWYEPATSALRLTTKVVVVADAEPVNVA